MRIVVVSKETIKPSSPTPLHLRVHKLSLIDQITPVIYGSVLIFYANPDENDQHVINVDDDKSQRLKKSLSRTLTQFYPLAGRIRDHSTVECNDEGADYIEASANCRLSDILRNPNPKLLREFSPTDYRSTECITGRLLLVQATFFQCGGLAIGLCITHKLADLISVTTFLKSWVAMAVGSSNAELPNFVGASLFPPKKLPFLFTKPPGQMTVTRTRRFVFNAAKIAELKAKVSSANAEQQPTRVEAVTALLWRCSKIASWTIQRKQRESILTQTFDLRPRINPPLKSNCVGNIALAFAAKSSENEIELVDLICQLRKAKEELNENGSKTVGQGKILKLVSSLVEAGNIMDDNRDYYNFTSWCRAPFSFYETDFGWGKPTWVSVAEMVLRNLFVLIDAKDGVGIEAWVSLDEEEMDLVESNKELLSYASLDPNVLHENPNAPHSCL